VAALAARVAGNPDAVSTADASVQVGVGVLMVATGSQGASRVVVYRLRPIDGLLIVRTYDSGLVTIEFVVPRKGVPFYGIHVVVSGEAAADLLARVERDASGE